MKSRTEAWNITKSLVLQERRIRRAPRKPFYRDVLYPLIEVFEPLFIEEALSVWG